MTGPEPVKKVFRVVEGGDVSHWVVAPDAGTARALVVGQMLMEDVAEEVCEREWFCEEVSIEKARGTQLRECEPEQINMWEACLAAKGPEYLACSEW
jgi:hypothetical protein